MFFFFRCCSRKSWTRCTTRMHLRMTCVKERRRWNEWGSTCSGSRIRTRTSWSPSMSSSQRRNGRSLRKIRVMFSSLTSNDNKKNSGDTKTGHIWFWKNLKVVVECFSFQIVNYQNGPQRVPFLNVFFSICWFLNRDGRNQNFFCKCAKTSRKKFKNYFEFYEIWICEQALIYVITCGLQSITGVCPSLFLNGFSLNCFYLNIFCSL